MKFCPNLQHPTEIVNKIVLRVLHKKQAAVYTVPTKFQKGLYKKPILYYNDINGERMEIQSVRPGNVIQLV